ncbi:MAG TPA: phosphomethylpyrimidine synthase ThiC, partial [Thiothrix sp.]|nr:phosphomethylpyrimidine synthase ThiC [Thiothrix sp.]
MSAMPDEFLQRTAKLSTEVTQPFPNSRKVYLTGSRPDIKVGIREIDQAETTASFGAEINPPIPVYDTSGVFGDP